MEVCIVVEPDIVMEPDIVEELDMGQVGYMVAHPDQGLDWA